MTMDDNLIYIRGRSKAGLLKSIIRSGSVFRSFDRVLTRLATHLTGFKSTLNGAGLMRAGFKLGPLPSLDIIKCNQEFCHLRLNCTNISRMFKGSRLTRSMMSVIEKDMEASSPNKMILEQVAHDWICIEMTLHIQENIGLMT